jgi:hypothetical protein
MNESREPRLVEEHLDELRLLGKVRMKAFDRDEPLKSAHPSATREEYRRHATRGNLANQLVAIDPLPSNGIGR